MYWLWYMIGNRLGYIKKVRMEYLPHILKTADIIFKKIDIKRINLRKLTRYLNFKNYDSVKMGNDQLIFVQKHSRNNKKPGISKEKKNNLLKKVKKEKHMETSSFGALGAYFNK